MRFLWTFAVACTAIIFCSARLAFPLDVTLAWDANTESNIAGYKIYYDTDSGQPYYGTGAEQGDSPIDVPLSLDENPDPNTVQYTVLALPAETYYFAVTAYDNEAPSNESGYSNEAYSGSTPDNIPPLISNVRVIPPSYTTAVITWTTDEPSNSQVLYGTLSESYPYNKSSIDLVTSHYITLTQLQTNTTYYFVVCSTDASGNGPTTSAEQTFITDALSDTTPPVISDVRATLTSYTTAVITWTTDEASNSQVHYGTLRGSYSYTRSDIGLVTNHYITLSQLEPNSTYYFVVCSTDASGNGPTTSAEQAFATNAPSDTTPPSVFQYPSIDYANRTIDVTFSEPNMQNAEKESNYAFSPPLQFHSRGAPNDIDPLDSSSYRLYMSYLPSSTIYTLTLSNITDQAGNPLTPSTVRINDNDDDGMADDWETANRIDNAKEDADSDGLVNLEEFQNLTDPNSWDTDGDALPDAWEVVYGLDPRDADGPDGGDGDIDHDGWSNYEEYVNDTNPVDGAPLLELPAPEIVETIPHNSAGITDIYRVPKETSFSVRIEASAGVNITDAGSVVFTIDDGVNNSYQRGLGDDVVKVVKLSDDADTGVTKLWVVYDRAGDTYGDFPFDAYITITVAVKDAMGLQDVQGTYHFKIESEMAHLEANDPANLPDTSVVDKSDPAIDGIVWDAGVEVNSGELRGAKIVYNSSEPTTPRFGPVYELPALTGEGTDKLGKGNKSNKNGPPAHSKAKANRTEVKAVGFGMNLQPPTVFNTPVKLFIPCPGYQDVSTLSVLIYNGKEWVLACDCNGNVMPDGEGWMVPGSRVNNNFIDNPINDPSTIEIQVYHFSGAQAGEVKETGDLAIDGGGSCFITAAAGVRSFKGNKELLGMLSDVTALVPQFGKAFVAAVALGAGFVLSLCIIRTRWHGAI
ncbi:MAG: hypothetical protein P8175_06375 [Deltaproteobacteria bacterium]|jgi:hypothetical protein